MLWQRCISTPRHLIEWRRQVRHINVVIIGETSAICLQRVRNVGFSSYKGSEYEKIGGCP